MGNATTVRTAVRFRGATTIHAARSGPVANGRGDGATTACGRFSTRARYMPHAECVRVTCAACVRIVEASRA